MLFDVQFCAAADGAQPLVDFLEALRASNAALHKLLVAGLVKLKDSHHHGPPLTEMVDSKHGILELRVGDANIARAFFFFRRGQRIVVTHGYVKKRQKVDPLELERARRYKQDWEERVP